MLQPLDLELRRHICDKTKKWRSVEYRAAMATSNFVIVALGKHYAKDSGKKIKLPKF